MIDEAVLLISKFSNFSPQKSNASVFMVLLIDSVSLNVYFKRLLTVKPAKAIRFSTFTGVVDITVFKQGSSVFNTKVESHVGGVMGGLKL